VLTPQEVHFYNKLVESEKVHNFIVCPSNSLDIVVMKLDEDDMVYFYCISCKTKFKLHKDIEDTIKGSILKYINIPSNI
jgi:hypothetical protein